MKPIISVEDISFSYRSGTRKTVPILNNLSFKIYPGEFVAIQGPSGSGKSTLLYLLGCMASIQHGRVIIGDTDISKLSEDQKALFRNANLGFVFQQFHLLPKADVFENILLSARYPVEQSKKTDAAMTKARQLAERLGLSDRLNHTPQELSGGQQQRVAIARALLNDANIILADEPTGNLDSKSAAVVINELKALKDSGKTIVLITHDKEIAAQADRRIFIQDGRVLTEEQPTPTPNKREIGISLPKLSLLSPMASYLKIFPFASANIFRNRARSILTMIGISIGVASVLAMVTLGQFAKDRILKSYNTLGVNTLGFRGMRNWDQKAIDKSGLSFNGFSWEMDLEPLKTIFPEIERISPVMGSWNTRFQFGGKTIDEEMSRVIGVNEFDFPITGRTVVRGSGISPFHVDRQIPVCVIGSEVVERLFSNIDPIGEVLTVAAETQEFGCRIIGIASTVEGKNHAPNLEVYIPYTYFKSVVGSWWMTVIRDVVIELKQGSEIEKTAQAIQAFFERKYGSSGKFRANGDSLLLQQMNRFLNIFSIFLASIALISLSVGGIGITNMMLVSVSERYREIGLRKAVGATNTSIRKQFLMEAVLLCGLAGVVGLIFGFIGYEVIIWGAAKFIPNFEFEWIVSFQALLMSTVSILAVGVLSGLVPAIKAEKLEPIEALRAE